MTAVVNSALAGVIAFTTGFGLRLALRWSAEPQRDTHVLVDRSTADRQAARRGRDSNRAVPQVDARPDVTESTPPVAESGREVSATPTSRSLERYYRSFHESADRCGCAWAFRQAVDPIATRPLVASEDIWPTRPGEPVVIGETVFESERRLMKLNRDAGLEPLPIANNCSLMLWRDGDGWELSVGRQWTSRGQVIDQEAASVALDAGRSPPGLGPRMGGLPELSATEWAALTAYLWDREVRRERIRRSVWSALARASEMLTLEAIRADDAAVVLLSDRVLSVIPNGVDSEVDACLQELKVRKAECAASLRAILGD